MAVITNNKENDFDIHLADGTALNIPGGKDGEKGFEPGTAVIDDDLLAEARKKPVVASWFESGALVSDGGSTKKQPKDKNPPKDPPKDPLKDKEPTKDDEPPKE